MYCFRGNECRLRHYHRLDESVTLNCSDFKDSNVKLTNNIHVVPRSYKARNFNCTRKCSVYLGMVLFM